MLCFSNKFRENSELYLKYDEIIEEHLRDGVVERVNSRVQENEKPGYFMPHHAVIRNQKDSTKVRIVFDASSKFKENLSLNDCLESGRNLNPDLLEIIIKFRVYPSASTPFLNCKSFVKIAQT